MEKSHIFLPNGDKIEIKDGGDVRVEYGCISPFFWNSSSNFNREEIEAYFKEGIHE